MPTFLRVSSPLFPSLLRLPRRSLMSMTQPTVEQYVVQTTAASKVPVKVRDRNVLLELARRMLRP